MATAVFSDTYQINIDSAAEYVIFPIAGSNSPSNVQVTIKNEGTKTAWISTAIASKGDAVNLTSGLTGNAVGVPDPAKGFSLAGSATAALGGQYIRPGRAQLYAICAAGDTTTLSIDIIKT